MAKRGRKTNAEKAQIAAETAKTGTTEGTTGEMSEDTTLDFSGADRNALYETYTKEQNNTEDTVTSAEQEVTEETTDKTPSEEAEIEAKSGELTETSTEEEVTAEKVTEEEVEEEVTEEKPAEGKEDKTVPLSALHEEREKRKSLSSKVAQLETQLRDILQDYKQRFEATEKPEDTTEELDEVGQLRREINDLKQWKTDKDEKTKRDDITVRIAHTNKQLADTNVKLEKEGYPGFSFVTATLTAELQRLIKEDPENQYLDQPSGWEKIYKERIFPTLKSKFTKQDKDEIFEKKKELKSQAKLSTGGVKPEVPEKKEETWTYNDYLQMRYEKQL